MSSQISIPLDSFTFDKNSNVLINNGVFRIKRNKKYYLVTNHRYLPLKNNILLKDEKLKICINCTWNEFLVLKENNPISNINKYEDIITFTEIATRLPNIGSTLFISQKKAIVKEFSFRNLAFIDNYPEIIYIKVNFKKPADVLPGTPIYSSNFILQGMVSYYDDTGIYCIPSYYLLKTFIKDNSLKVPILKDDIVRINRYFIKNGLIFNPYLGINIPVLSHYLLEDSLLAYKEDSELPEEIDFKDSKHFSEIENRRNLVVTGSYYHLTTSSLHLLKIFYPEHAELLNDYVQNDSIEKIKFKIKKNNLIISN